MSFSSNTDHTWNQLAAGSGEPRRPLFAASSLNQIPEPAARWLRRAIPDGSQLHDTAIINMSGEIKIGGRWRPFVADQILRANVGFVWRPVVGRVLRFTGADLLYETRAAMQFRLFGLFPVANAEGLDVAQSAAGRLAAETVAWLPQSATPQFGAVWRELSDNRAIVEVPTPVGPVDVEIGVAADGRLTSIALSRLSLETEPPSPQRFGGHLRTELISTDQVRVSGSGDVGWHVGTPRWYDGRFFRFQLAGHRTLSAGSGPVGEPPNTTEGRRTGR